MPELILNLNGDGILKDFPREKVIEVNTPITVTCLEGGMQSGKPSVAFIIDLPDGRKVFAQTSMQLFVSTAEAMLVRFSDVLTQS